jgi:hypothetical protein
VCLQPPYFLVSPRDGVRLQGCDELVDFTEGVFGQSV